MASCIVEIASSYSIVYYNSICICIPFCFATVCLRLSFCNSCHAVFFFNIKLFVIINFAGFSFFE